MFIKGPYQRGFGFGSLFKRSGIPILKFFGKHALKTAVNTGQDILEKKKVKEAMIARGKESFEEMASDSLKKLNNFVDQKGGGIV